MVRLKDDNNLGYSTPIPVLELALVGLFSLLFASSPLTIRAPYLQILHPTFQSNHLAPTDIIPSIKSRLKFSSK
jgi:hypothetical protein